MVLVIGGYGPAIVRCVLLAVPTSSSPTGSPGALKWPSPLFWQGQSVLFSLLACMPPLWFVQGSTIYGGASIDNLLNSSGRGAHLLLGESGPRSRYPMRFPAGGNQCGSQMHHHNDRTLYIHRLQPVRGLWCTYHRWLFLGSKTIWVLHLATMLAGPVLSSVVSAPVQETQSLWPR